MATFMLTTLDNPYNPFTQFDEWRTFDEGHGYHTMAFLARVVLTSDSLPEAQRERDIEVAMDEIIEHNVLGMYRKVTADDEKFSDTQ